MCVCLVCVLCGVCHCSEACVWVLSGLRECVCAFRCGLVYECVCVCVCVRVWCECCDVRVCFYFMCGFMCVNVWCCVCVWLCV